jgi:hypothetical protein
MVDTALLEDAYQLRRADTARRAKLFAQLTARERPSGRYGKPIRAILDAPTEFARQRRIRQAYWAGYAAEAIALAAGVDVATVRVIAGLNAP